MTEGISAVICTLNEESNIAACIKAVEGVDEIVVADDGSEDRTVELAESMGARVFRRRDWASVATTEDVERFTDRFGWQPSFGEGTRIRNGHLEATEAMHAASNDWVVMPDADERVVWELPSVKDILPEADQVSCAFVNSFDKDGRPGQVSTKIKMFRHSVTQVVGRTHSGILPSGRVVHSDRMRIDHWQADKHDAASPAVLQILEYSAAVEDDQRTRFYLGREYMYRQRHEQALSMLRRYLSEAVWLPEIVKARIYEGRCLWALGRGEEAREAVLKAVVLDPDDKLALGLMAEYHFEPWKSKWARLAEAATSSDVLY